MMSAKAMHSRNKRIQHLLLSFICVVLAVSLSACEECVASGEDTWCEGNSVYYCEHLEHVYFGSNTEVRRAVNCDNLDAKCFEATDTLAYCALTDETCPPNASSMCVGEYLCRCYEYIEDEPPRVLLDSLCDEDRHCMTKTGGLEGFCSYYGVSCSYGADDYCFSHDFLMSCDQGVWVDEECDSSTKCCEKTDGEVACVGSTSSEECLNE